jgi:hypothetical protein
MKKITILKGIQQIVYQFSEHTPPQVKYSRRNHLVGNIVEAIGELIKDIRQEKAARKKIPTLQKLD